MRIGAHAALWLLTVACSAHERPPSILLVTIDTARADAFGAYGGKASTPTFDALAQNGVLFTRAATPVPITHPAHTSLLTGLYPARHGVRDNGLFTLDDHALTLAEILQARGYDTAAFVSAVVLARGFGLAQGFAHYDDAGLSATHLERPAGETVAAAVAHLRAARTERPFFCWVHLYDPHFPYQPPEPFAARFHDQPYLGEVSYADAETDRLIVAARARDPSTVIVITADHGEGLGEHGEATHGIFLYQSTMRVPLVIAGGSLPRGQRCEHLVSLLDVAPTLCEVAGAEIPGGLDGRSLVRELHGGAADDPPLALETMLPYLSYGWSALHALVRNQVKVIAAPRPELYDLARDPHEQHDLAAERAAQLAAGLRAIAAARAALKPQTASPYAAAQQALQKLGYVSTPRAIDGRETAAPIPRTWRRCSTWKRRRSGSCSAPSSSARA
ncbi:MAG: sulfatase [Planctomycetota bacterium]